MRSSALMLVRPYAPGIMLLVAALAVYSWPAPARMPPPAPIIDNGPFETFAQISIEPAAHLFDLSSLPPIEQPKTEPVKIDPAAAVKAHTLLGVTMNETGAIALITDGQNQFALKIGDQLAGFEIVDIRPREVDFKQNDISATMQLPDGWAPSPSENGD